jgi:hypothetical protein
MKKCWYAATLLACAFALHAETPVIMHAPFEFVAGGKSMPAGDYHLELMTPSVMLITGEDPHDRVLALVTSSPGSAVSAARFDTSGAEPVLASVSSPAGTWRLPASGSPHVAIALRPKK